MLGQDLLIQCFTKPPMPPPPSLGPPPTSAFAPSIVFQSAPVGVLVVATAGLEAMVDSIVADWELSYKKRLIHFNFFS